jgi:transcriptional repressor NrdR
LTKRVKVKYNNLKGSDVMKCPYCSYQDSKVLESRTNEESNRIRRRRECLSCKKRFTTYEIVETVPLMILKKDNTVEAFDRNKVLNGIIRACQKRPVSVEKMEQIVTEIEQQLLNSLEREVPSTTIGELVMEKLKQTDEVAYVRFASVYRQFSDVDSFMAELNELFKNKKK